MLFHGTNAANLISILEQGLCIQPQNAARHHGSAFGRGIYFADKLSRALHYASNDKPDDSFFVLDCEVALGNCMNSLCGDRDTNSSGYFCSGDDFAKGYHSVRVMGSNGPNFDENWIPQESKQEQAPIWPIGRIIQYPEPFYMYKNTSYTVLNELVSENNAKQAKAKKVKKVKGKKVRRDSDEEDEESDQGNDDDELAKKLTKVGEQT